jgi:hypothetical protein
MFPVVYPGPVPPSAPLAAAPLASMPWLTPVPPGPPTAPVSTILHTPAAQPTVVVVREPADAAPRAAEQPRGPLLGAGALFGLGVGALGLGFGLVVWRRSARETPPPLPPAPPAAPGGVVLMGQYDAGPLPEPAERFEIGPTYHGEREKKKRAEAEGQQAMVEFILAQNLALHAELAGPAADPEPVADEDLPFAQ